MGFSDADMMGRGGKTGTGRQMSESQENQARRERLRKLALETVDLNKDPYFMRNHLGTYECKLCLTIHTNEGNYLAHTQGKRHQQNIARRLAKDAFEAQVGGVECVLSRMCSPSHIGYLCAEHCARNVRTHARWLARWLARTHPSTHARTHTNAHTHAHTC